MYSGEKSLSDHELDRFIVNLKPHYEKINCKFLVHLSSEFDVDGHQAGSRITAWVDRNLHTLTLRVLSRVTNATIRRSVTDALLVKRMLAVVDDDII